MLSKLFGQQQKKQKQEQEQEKAAEARRQQEQVEETRRQQVLAAEARRKQEKAKRDEALAAKVKSATDAAKSLISRRKGRSVMIFREMYDLPLLTSADKESGPWESRGLAVDGNQDGSYFIVENSKGELRRAEPAIPGF